MTVTAERPVAAAAEEDPAAAARSAAVAAYAFGPFVLNRAQKQLLLKDEPVRLGSRAFDLLDALVARAGVVVSRAELEACVWPRSVVEETSLRVHMSALRRALGDGVDGARYIANVPGRGYSFVAEVKALTAPPVHALAPIDHNLPTRLTREIGRQAMIAEVAGHLAERRLVSIVGAGGMGKTTVALAVAEKLLQNYPDGVWFVDLAPLTDAAHVPACLATALGLILAPGEVVAGVCACLRGRQALLVLDNCEHVVDAIAALAERLLAVAPRLGLLATSREPLAVAGEWVCRIGGLAAPLPDAAPTLAQAMAFPAVQLFVERSLANADATLMSDANCGLITHLCRRLDGMPLAIELAAGCMDSLGPRGLAERLDQMFELLTRGRRSALPRQRTLQALLDWSHRLLSEPERIVLRRLSVFRGSFSAAAAAAVASCARVSPVEVIECLIGLAAKSLVAQEARGDEVRNRLLYTTRTYAEARLADSGERAQLARRHAEYMRELLDSTIESARALTPAAWNARHGSLMDDVRAAMEWADGPNGDPEIGASLAVSAFLPTYANGRLDEFRARLEHAIAGLAALPQPQPERELHLYAAMNVLMGQTVTDEAQRQRVAERTIALAALHEDQSARIRALYGICLAAFGQGAYPAALEHARRIRQLVAADPTAATLLGDRLLAQTQHAMGRHAQAAPLAVRVLAHPPVRLPQDGLVPRSVSMRIVLARILWLQGSWAEAAQMAAEAMRLADEEPGLSQIQVLSQVAVPIALWSGERARAAAMVDQLDELAGHYGIGYWIAWAASLRGVLQLDSRFGAVAPDNSKELDMLCTLDTRYCGERALARCSSGEVGWCAPEILRGYGENLLRAQPASTAVAEGFFARAWELAREQQALSWQLRAACSSARSALARHAPAEHRCGVKARLAAARALFRAQEQGPDLAEADRLLALLLAP